jgi:3-phenylpropionate/trans-cinnamate dioxygenase ferredoxin subunit
MKWYKLFDDLATARRSLANHEVRRADIGGLKVCLISIDDQIHAFNDQCPHMRASLASGRINGFGEIICPLHFYRFDLKTGRESQNRCDDLDIYAIDYRDDGIYLGMR